MSEHSRNTGPYYFIICFPGSTLGVRAWKHKTWTRNFTSEAQEHSIHYRTERRAPLAVFYIRTASAEKQMGHTVGTARPVDSTEKQHWQIMHTLCYSPCVRRNLSPRGQAASLMCSSASSCPTSGKKAKLTIDVLSICAQRRVCTVKAVGFCWCSFVLCKLNGRV